jgi:hypothetical protein
MLCFAFGLFILSATTLMYEVIITRLMSVMTIYYLAFVSVSIAMLGMTAGALFVQLRPNLFTAPQAARRLSQAALAMAISLPLALLTMQSVPIDFEFNLQMLYSFLLFSALMAVPFFCSGVGICIALTRTQFSIGKVYAVDLLGAAAGSLGAIGLLELMDPSSAILAISALSFLGAAVWVVYAGEGPRIPRLLLYAVGMAAITALNIVTPSAFRPLWCKGKLERRAELSAEVWNPISRIRAFKPVDRMSNERPLSWGASQNVPPTKVNTVVIDIDNLAGTPLLRYGGTPGELSFLAYDVSAIAPSLRAGGSAAIIGVGGGRDVLTAHYFNFRRIVGIELNPGIVDLVTRRFRDYGGINTISGLDIYNDEGRSYLSRTPEKFDVVQVSMVDTWAATAAGAMSLSENSLYTVETWRIFYDHLKPDGLITFTRWNYQEESIQTKRMFALGGIIYFIGIGLGFMLAEMAMMQQLSIFLGQPIHSMIVTLCGLILATGIGSLVSERLSLGSAVAVRTPAIASGAILICYSAVVLPIIHQLAYLSLWPRALIGLGLVTPCGLLFGFCFPVGLRWMRELHEEESLPWMWALNGAASVLASFIAMLISIEVSITASVLTAAACYIAAGLAMPWASPSIAGPERVLKDS